MESILADFRIENDSVILLSFTNGSSYRVNPRDLERHLSQEDLTKVRQALRLRKRFMRSVLPPTAMILLLISVVGMGGYDMHQISADMQAARKSHTITPQSVAPTLAPAAQPMAPVSATPAIPASQPSSARVPSEGGTSGKAAAPTIIKATPSVGHVTTSTPALTPPSVPHVNPVKSLVPPILKPITTPLTQALPITSQLLPPGL